MLSQILRLSSVCLLLAPLAGMAEPNAGAEELTYEGQLLVTLHTANLMEISAGQMAIAKGTSAAIRQYGAELVKDHSAADEQLLVLAAKRNVTIPPAVAGESSLKPLSSLTGDAFDRAFVQMMVDDHTKAISLVKTSLARISNVEMRTYLNSLLPTLERHLDTALAIQKGARSQL